MGIKNFHQNCRDHFSSEVENSELSPESKESLRLATKVLISDGMTVLTRLYHRVSKNTDPETKARAFYIAFREYLLETVATNPALHLLLFVCDRSDRVTTMKAKTQQKRSKASLRSSRPGSSSQSSSKELLQSLNSVSLSAQTHCLSIVEGESADVNLKLSDLCAHDLLHVRKHRRVLFEYLVQCLRKDAHFTSGILKKKPGFALLFDMGGRDERGEPTTYLCQVNTRNPSRPSVSPSLSWSERSGGFWAGAEEGEADLTCWEWYARLCSAPEGRRFWCDDSDQKGGQAKGSAQSLGSVVIETIDTDLVLIGLLLTWQQAQGVGRAGRLSQTPPCFLYFTNRFTWDIRSLFHSLRPATGSSKTQEHDFELLAFIWTHMTQGTDFCDKKDLSDRVNFGNVLRAVRAYLPRHQALCALSPGIGGSALFHPRSLEEFLRLLCSFFPAPKSDPLALARARRGASGVQLLGCCLALCHEKQDKRGQPSWSGMAPVSVLREAYVTWRCSVDYWFERRDPLRCSRASVDTWNREAGAWCRQEVKKEEQAREEVDEEVRARLAKLQTKSKQTTPSGKFLSTKKEIGTTNLATSLKQETQVSTKKKRFRPVSERPVLSSGWVVVKKNKSKPKNSFKAKN